MKESRKRVKTYIVRAVCEECGQELKFDKLRSDGMMQALIFNDMAAYAHKCENGHEENLERQYPYITYD